VSWRNRRFTLANTDDSSFGARDDYPVHDTTERAEGKGLGGVGGIVRVGT
jgi:hypothetical protein